MTDRNRLQLFRSTTPGRAPLLSELLTAELATNVFDKRLYLSTGSEVIQINHASNVETDAGHRFVTDSQIAQFGAHTSKDDFGQVKVGDNIDVNNGVISLAIATSEITGLLSSTDFATFLGKQDALGYTPVNRAGDTMLGTLVLAGSPVADNDASNKAYVDIKAGAAVQKSGDTMSGLLVLSADPEQNLGAATKQYVDNSVSLISGEYASPVQTLAVLSALPSAGIQDKQMRLVEDEGAIFRYDVQSTVPADGAGVIRPDDISSGEGRWLKVQAATQNHNHLLGLQGGAEDDYLHLTTAEKNSYDAHLADMTIHLTPAQKTFLGNINATATELNYSIGVTSPIQEQIDGKQDSLGYTPVNRAGDTMQGTLKLFGSATADEDAVSLGDLKAFAIDCGEFV